MFKQIWNNWKATVAGAKVAVAGTPPPQQLVAGKLPKEVRRILNTEYNKAVAVDSLTQFAIDRDVIVAGFKVIHNAGSFTGGTTPALIANAIWKKINVSVDTQPIISLDKARNGTTPAGVVLHTIMKMLAQHSALPNETWPMFLNPYLPPKSGAGKVQVDLQVGAIADFATGSPTAYTGATAWLQLHAASQEAWKSLGQPAIPEYMVQLVERSSNSFGASTGKKTFDLPTGVIYDPLGVILHVQDNGTLADEKFDDIEIKAGQDTIYKGHERLLKLETQEKAMQAVTGYYWIQLDAPLDTHDIDSVKVEVEIPNAGTDIKFTAITFTRLRPKVAI